ncbi:MAG: hypothetical protein AAGN46_13795 [Acidobacteriota bacterium]
MTTPAATGRTTAFQLGFERRPGVPGSGLQAYQVALPAGTVVARPLVSPGTVDPRGFSRLGRPGAVDITTDFAVDFVAHLQLPFLYHLLGGGLTKTVLEAGVWQYAFEAQSFESRTATSFYTIDGTPSVKLRQVYDVELHEGVWAIGENVVVLPRFKGVGGHATLMGPPVADVGNTGTHQGPALRGVPRDPETPIHLQITRDVAGGGVRFQLEQATVPAWAGPETDVLLDPAGEPDWQIAQGADGLDLGRTAGDWDPVDVHLLDPAQLALLEIGDVFTWAPYGWSTPAAPAALATAAHAFSSAHERIEIRTAGSADPWERVLRDDSTYTLSAPIAGSRAGKYIDRMYRTGEVMAKVAVSRKKADRRLQIVQERAGLLDVRASFAGRQLGTGAHRESVVWHQPSSQVEGYQDTASSPDIVVEQAELVARAPDDGSAPLTVTVVTDVDWTPPA